MAKALSQAQIDEIVTRLVALVEEHGALPAHDLKSVRRILPQLMSALEKRGVEVAKQVRVPLRAQICRALRERPMALKELGNEVVGSSTTELKREIAALALHGEVLEVITERGSLWMHRDAASGMLLDGADHAALLRLLTRAQKLLRKAHGKNAKGTGRAKASVLLAETVGPLAPWLRGRASPGSEVDPKTDDVRALLEMLDAALAEEPHRPRSVAEVFRSLGAGSGAKNALARTALLLGARSGRFTLEPESGMGRLSDSDAAICPSGPRGTVLSWYRRNA
jgi:hypothetical protein